MWAIPTGTSSALKKKSGKESQYMVSYPELGSDPPIGSDRESGRDTINFMIPNQRQFPRIIDNFQDGNCHIF